MSTDDYFAYDSEETDEDFCPENVSDTDSEAEVKSDAAISEHEDDEEKQNNLSNGKGNAKKNATKTKAVETEATTISQRRSTRQIARAAAALKNKSAFEKDELESDEETNKSRSDALWADFLSNADDVAASAPTVGTMAKEEEEPLGPNDDEIKCKTKKTAKSTIKSATASESDDSDDEYPAVKKCATPDSVKENKNQKIKATTTATTTAATTTTTASNRILRGVVPTTKALGNLKRPLSSTTRGAAAARPGGLGSVLNQIGKKKKMSVLEKSQEDWNSYKQDNGLEEELQTHNKGKDGYLERQDFLQRTDLRQFELEKNLRQTRRKQ